MGLSGGSGSKAQTTRKNQTIKCERHLTLTVDDILADLNGAKVFSTPDLAAGYHQIELHPDPPPAGNPVDYFSRKPVPTHESNDTHATKLAEAHVRFIVDHVVPLAMTLQEIHTATQSDPCLQRVIAAARTGQWHTLLEQTADMSPAQKSLL